MPCGMSVRLAGTCHCDRERISLVTSSIPRIVDAALQAVNAISMQEHNTMVRLHAGFLPEWWICAKESMQRHA